MQSTVAIALALSLVCNVGAAAPTYSCFDPPDEGQSNPLGEGMEEVVGAECCEALIDESDILAERKVVWDPVNCNHGPGLFAITEAFLCRAHDTDGCRFCRDNCEGFEGLCLTCEEVLLGSMTGSPTPSPSDFGGLFPGTISPDGGPFEPTGAPFGIFPETPSPTTAPPLTVETPAPTITIAGGVGDVGAGCQCIQNLSETEADVLERRGKTMTCDPSCTDGSDLTWGIMNCNYFALGQECRACATTCERQPSGEWLDEFDAFCKPCSAIF